MTAVPISLVASDPENALRFLGHREHSHDWPHLIYVVAGTAHLDVDGTAMTLHAHESVWLAPDVPHAARYAPGSLVLGPMLSPGTSPRGRVRRLPPLPELTLVMTAVLGVAPQTEEQITVFRKRLDAVLGALREPLFPLVMPRHPAAAAVARDCIASDSPLAELAADHGLSARQVQRIFVSETGLPFRRWRVRARLNIAGERLHGGSSVGAAGAVAGYGTASGLRKALRREAGIDVADLRLRPSAAS
ncbi:helix-turn-helix domain-containing protein [Gordonia caeni]|uniref:Helix-turn-helix transcriptional regulator n=1 Tax=Gordonia caeni TaxID=1007097 RepID=A0ABP7NZ37_9ACTN